MNLTRTITGDEPVTLNEAKLWSKIDFGADDSIIRELIPAAREVCENYTGRTLVDSTAVVEFFGANVPDIYCLPFSDGGEITEVKLDGEILTDYNAQNRGRIYFGPDEAGLYQISYTSKGNCPVAIKSAIRRIVADMYESRNSESGMSAEVMRWLMPFTL